MYVHKVTARQVPAVISAAKQDLDLAGLQPDYCDTVIVVSCFALEVVGGIKNPDMAAINAALIAELGALRNAASTLAVIAPNEAFLTLTHRGAAMLDGRLGPEAFRIGYAQALQEAEDIRLTWNS